jgi:Flp pilus assembly protein TadG
MLRARRQKRGAGPARRGLAAVEAAVCLPVIVALVLGTIETCNMIFLDETLLLSAYEGARVAIRADATNTTVTAACNTLPTARGIVGTSVGFSAEDVSKVARGAQITVTVSAPCNTNSPMKLWFYKDRTLSESVVMVKE